MEKLIECRFSLQEESTNRIVTEVLQTFDSTFDRTRLSRTSDAVDRRLGEDPQAYQDYTEEKTSEQQKTKQLGRGKDSTHYGK